MEKAAEAQAQYHQFQRSRIEMVRGYAEVRDCRREYLLNYFGQELDDPCSYCDNCDARTLGAEDEAAEPFSINTRVTHATWGKGMVLRYEGDKMVVLFDSVGYKTLSVAIVTENGLLQPASQRFGACALDGYWPLGPGAATHCRSFARDIVILLDSPHAKGHVIAGTSEVGRRSECGRRQADGDVPAQGSRALAS